MIKSSIRLLSVWSTFFRYPSYKESRLGAVLWYNWFATIGLLLASRGIPPPNLVGRTLAVTTLITVFVYILNDVMDADIDRLNPTKSNRPIPSGLASKKEALSLSLLCGVLGLFFGFSTNTLVGFFASLYMILGVLYSTPPIRLKNKFLMKELVLGLGLLISVLLGGSFIGFVSIITLFAGIFLFISAIVFYPTFEDAMDVEEDRLDGCKTLAMILEQKKRLELTIIGVIFIMVITPFTYLHFGLNTICPIIICVACLLFLRYLFPLLFTSNERIINEILGRGRTFVRLFVLVIQIGFIIGSLELL